MILPLINIFNNKEEIIRSIVVQMPISPRFVMKRRAQIEEQRVHIKDNVCT